MMKMLILLFVAFLPMAVSTRRPTKVANTVNGLQMSLTHANATQAMKFVVTFTNTTQTDLTITPGLLVDCGVAPSNTSLVALSLTDSQGKQHRHLPYLGDGPPYMGFFCAGQIEPFTVVVHARESVSQPLDLGKYFDLTDAKQYEMARFHAGDYTLQAEFTMKSSESRTLTPISTNLWSGCVYSNTVQVHFGSEFAAPNANYPD